MEQYQQKIFNQMWKEPQPTHQINKTHSPYETKSSTNLKIHHKTRSKHQIFKPNIVQLHSEVQRFNPKCDDALSDNSLSRIDKSIGKKSANNGNIESRYETIQSFLKTQNVNLKEQNKMLLEQIKKILNRQKKIKELYNKSQQQIIMLRQQRDIYHSQLEQLKFISNNELKKMQSKLNNQSFNTQQQFQNSQPNIISKKLTINTNTSRTNNCKNLSQIFNRSYQNR